MNDATGLQLSQPFEHFPHDVLDLLGKQRRLALDEVLEQIAAVEGVGDDVVAVFRLVDSLEPQ